MYRQGDVLIVPCKSIPDAAKPEKRDAGRVILAYGEATGHAHAIADSHATLLSFGAERYLRASRPVRLYHDEHEEIRLPAGDYQIVHQREYSPEEIRRVAD